VEGASGNQGHLYTGGLFRYSRHINYFGDLLLFLGCGILTGQLWTGIVPLAMGVNFALVIIPAHDAYLAMRYGREFDDYAKRTRNWCRFSTDVCSTPSWSSERKARLAITAAILSDRQESSSVSCASARNRTCRLCEVMDDQTRPWWIVREMPLDSPRPRRKATKKVTLL